MGVLTLRPRPSALGARTSHPRPLFTLNDRSQVRPGLPACEARSCVIGTLPANDRVATVTVSGGVGLLMADDANRRRLAVPPMPESPQRRMLELVPIAPARNAIDVTGQFLNDPSLLDQAIELAATNGDYRSLVSFHGLIGRNPALMEATRASWIERMRANPDKHFAVSGFCTEDYTRDLEAVGIPVYEEATHVTRAVAALAGFARSFRERRARPAVPASPRARPRVRRPARPRRSALRPEIPQAERDRIERPYADRIIVLCRRDKHPLSFAELERLQGAVGRVDELQVPDFFGGRRPGACPVDRAGRVETDSTSHSQSGARVTYAVSDTGPASPCSSAPIPQSGSTPTAAASKGQRTARSTGFYWTPDAPAQEES